jgi:mRNA-degrading endonuclease RelE of RelBE toxin-antitoxin system
MNSRTTKSFRDALKTLSPELRKQAEEAYRQFKNDPFSPGLNFEEVNGRKHIWSVRITKGFRAVTVQADLRGKCNIVA